MSYFFKDDIIQKAQTFSWQEFELILLDLVFGKPIIFSHQKEVSIKTSNDFIAGY